MGGVVWGGEVLVAHLALAARARDLVLILALIPLAAASYAGLLWLLRIEGREDMEIILAKLRGRKT
jgi:putative peptidoglycan lipid II flippase